ncbi:MAG: hypothetical protein WHS64_05110 [Fervidobacterium sp.]|uniref:hypothetical protein n=1 Tax=Fervidobacterium sp. TaxID=1871331 RepID=UPI0030AF1CBE
MLVEVNNLALYDVYNGFSKYNEQIFQCKVNLLVKLSKTYRDAHFVFYNIIGQYGLFEDVYKILEDLFDFFEISNDSVDEFNSSPINNFPKIRVDGNLVEINDCETIGLKKILKVENLKCEYSTCYYYLENPSEKDLDEKIFGIKIDILPKKFIESDLLNLLDSTGKRYLVLKLLRGEEICL